MMITCPNGHTSSAAILTDEVLIRDGRSIKLAGNQWLCPQCEVLWEISKDPQTGRNLVVLNPPLVPTRKSKIRAARAGRNSRDTAHSGEQRS